MPYVALFLLWPFLEIALFVRVASAIGSGAVVMLCLLAAVAGGYLLQIQGMKTMALLRRSAIAGRMPEHEAFGGFCMVVAGILLIIPGFISDCAAFLLLIPAVRGAIFSRLTPVTTQKEGDSIIEGEFTRVDDHDKPVLPIDHRNQE